ncbi:PREDICTED: uncharacterized protein LOC105368637 [Ceratosolen solmsi marchali]|uniref:Uncharacterized protein LOC105368637 n=1 Tax=Ceratosolen solmsi marchali TaxID=326594 RepID=A0AAJ6YX70_9HYME|nr:PREDICTED: uncharacterized protein LOC105368637 [Ceratosolen solmsi marchali]
MTSSHVYHHAKFRWTENLTCRFIQLRKEHGKMFTGRKYSAQVGWEYILRQMREEFPTIMADVHYRVLKKKWSNLLQQYKELKNPVHGDKNRADDISWPFYTAIDEVLGNLGLPSSQRRASCTDEHNVPDDEDLDPQEFLYVSVSQDDENDESASVDHLGINEYQRSESERVPGLPRLQPLRQERRRGPVSDSFSERTTRRSTTSTRKRLAPADGVELLARLPAAVELSMRPICRSGAELPALEPISTATNGSPDSEECPGDGNRPRKRGRDTEEPGQESETRLERRIAEFFEYIKRRDEENRSILMRMLVAIEDIRNVVS